MNILGFVVRWRISFFQVQHGGGGLTGVECPLRWPLEESSLQNDIRKIKYKIIITAVPWLLLDTTWTEWTTYIREQNRHSLTKFLIFREFHNKKKTLFTSLLKLNYIICRFICFLLPCVKKKIFFSQLFRQCW